MPTTAVRPVILVSAAALIDRDGRVLVTRRPTDKTMPGLWEFPGGKVQPGESPEAALVRELMEEVGIDTVESCLAPIGFSSHDYDDFHLVLLLFVCRRFKGTATPLENNEVKWARPRDLRKLAMPPADDGLVASLIDLL